MFFTKKRNAALTVELAVSLVLIVIVLFVAIGLFNDNLKNMFVNGNIRNIFNAEELKTYFSFFNKDYTSSQINVQVTGEQGLERLRLKANNNSLDIINPVVGNGGHLTIGAGNTIIYLNKIIMIIVGEGNICKTMTEDSKEKCIKITGNKYIIEYSGNSLTIRDLNNNIVATASGSGLITSQVPQDTDPWAKINAITSEYNGKINQAQSLTRTINYFNNQISSIINASNGSHFSTVEEEIISLLNSVTESMEDANEDCEAGLNSFLHGNLWKERCKQYPNDGTLNAFKIQVNQIKTAINGYAAESNAIKSQQNNYIISDSTLNKNVFTKEETNNLIANSNIFIHPNLPTTGGIVTFGSSDALTTVGVGSSDYEPPISGEIGGGAGSGSTVGGNSGGNTGGNSGGGAVSGGTTSFVDVDCPVLTGYNSYCSPEPPAGSNYRTVVLSGAGAYTFNLAYLKSNLHPLPTMKIDGRLATISNINARTAVMINYAKMLTRVYGDNALKELLIKDGYNKSYSRLLNGYESEYVGLKQIAESRGMISSTTALRQIISNSSN